MQNEVQIGILSLQGAFACHEKILHTLGVKSRQVRTCADLELCDALILPGGESTVMTKQLLKSPLCNALLEFAASRPVFGTCAGMILMAETVSPQEGVKTLGLLPIHVARNAYGRQTESFCTSLKIQEEYNPPYEISALFIRAPKILSCDPSIKCLASFQDEPVFVEKGLHMACSFHPELGLNTKIHEYFLSKVKSVKTHLVT